MKKSKNFDTYTKLFLSGVFIVTIFDLALVLSISIRSVIYAIEGKWLIIAIQALPLVFFSTLLIFETKLLIKFFKNLKKAKQEDEFEKYIRAHDLTIKDNMKGYKKEMIFVYLSSSFIVLFGGIGVIPLVFLLKGEKAYKIWSKDK
ncbi:hypothetical protein [Spiroplasma monobiae]|uniref:Transmembrane protein n=1 Tax=Spiroplasma monobiae MQ-1 TaxID=1336748 RepID=A0A2K9LUF4_SPISQ|nr:hypothetical protein [Spiroplasma monobiae]AUM62677.1 hypothetical protein SMONO_v1c04280 [Spiroplasma monobiae MQ-1]